jgi:glycosyltransferase involved in cell wall biosynthesis
MRVLLLNPLIPDYRIAIFNLLGEKVDLTIAHSAKIRTEKNLQFKQKYLPLKHLGPFSFYPINLHKLCKQYDVVISEGNIRYLDRNILILNPFRKYKWINWGIGVSASYNKLFDQDKKFDAIRHFIFKRANAQIFYSEYPVQKYKNAGFNSDSLFVANNTTFVSFNNDREYPKYKILFVGTLYKQKKIYELLEAYLNYSKLSKNCLPLEIIGNGDEFERIKNWIDEKNIQTKIILHGAIFDHQILEKHFREAIACISPGQAGLSVLTSMGYGTPFITQKEAITGGEIFNIIDQYNGILYASHEELNDIMEDIEMNKEKYLKMGENARNFYLKQRLPEQMVEAIYNACKFVFINSYK